MLCCAQQNVWEDAAEDFFNQHGGELARLADDLGVSIAKLKEDLKEDSDAVLRLVLEGEYGDDLDRLADDLRVEQ
jgi:hypothetical protein